MKMKKTLLTLVVLLLSAMAFAEHWTDNYSAGQWCTVTNSKTGEKMDAYIIKKDAKNRILIYVGKVTGSWRSLSKDVNICIYTDKGNYWIEMTSGPGYDWFNAGGSISGVLSTALANKNLPFSEFAEVMKFKVQEAIVTATFGDLRGFAHIVLCSEPFEPFTSDFNGREVNGIKYYPGKL